MAVHKHYLTGIPDDFYIRTIDEKKIPLTLGETAYWHCDFCQAWRHATIAEKGIQCPVCGTYADLKNERKLPVLAFESRLSRVQNLCTAGSNWDTTYLGLVDNYAEGIDQIWEHTMPKATQRTFYRFFGSVWKEVSGLADYLLTAKDATVADVPYAYTDDGLEELYYDGRRKYNICNYGSLNITAAEVGGDEKNDHYTLEELVEMAAFRNGYTQPFYNNYFSLDDFCTGITDSQDRTIVKCLYQGYSKTEVAQGLGLSIQNLRTRIKHIAAVTKSNI